MPNPWSGIGNPYTRQEVIGRLHSTLDRGEAIIAAGAGTGISAKFIAKGGAGAILTHVGTTVGGSIGVGEAAMNIEEAARRTQGIIDAGKSVRDDVIYLSHGGPILTPADAAPINVHTDAVGLVGASSLERIAIEESLTELTREFKAIPVKRRTATLG